MVEDKQKEIEIREVEIGLPLINNKLNIIYDKLEAIERTIAEIKLK